jgi:ATP-dependent DNA ligase
MTLPVRPPLAPMLGRRADELPAGEFVYEPKWDGFRCLAFRDGDDVDLRSRHDRPLARYFPELVDALRALPEPRFVLDGEILVTSGRGFDFEALLARVHPAASSVERLRRETPARFVAFDVVARGDDDVRERPFSERRAELERLLAGARDLVKVKRERTADCVVAGFRVYADRPLVSSLLLGLYGDEGALHHFGIVQAFTNKRRRELLEELSELAVPLAGHPWEQGMLVGGGTTGRLAALDQLAPASADALQVLRAA